MSRIQSTISKEKLLGTLNLPVMVNNPLRLIRSLHDLFRAKGIFTIPRNLSMRYKIPNTCDIIETTYLKENIVTIVRFLCYSSHHLR